MSKSVHEYFRHIADEISFLTKESSALTEEQFMYDQLHQRAFARSLEIIGEAVKQISDDERAKYPDIDWKSYAGLRDKLIHRYFGVDYAIVWDVVKNELPLLLTKIQHILEK